MYLRVLSICFWNISPLPSWPLSHGHCPSTGLCNLSPRVSQELPNWPDLTTPPIPTCLPVRSRPWDEMRIHKQVIYQEVFLGETAKEVQEARQGGEESKQSWAFTHSPAFAWPRRELWSVHCTSVCAEWRKGSWDFISLHCRSLAKGCPKGCQFTSTFSTLLFLSKFLL